MPANTFLGGRPGSGITLAHDGVELTVGDPGYTALMAAEIAPIARLLFAEFEHAVPPRMAYDFAALDAHIAQRLAEADEIGGEAGRAHREHAHSLQADRAEIEARILGFNAAVVFVEALLSGAARLAAMRKSLGAVDEDRLLAALVDNLDQASSLLAEASGGEPGGYPSPLRVSRPLAAILQAALASGTSLMTGLLEYEVSSFAVYQFLLATAEERGGAEDDRAAAKVRFEELAIEIREHTAALATLPAALVDLVAPPSTALADGEEDGDPLAGFAAAAAVTELRRALAELVEVVSAIDAPDQPRATAALAAFGAAMERHARDLFALQQAMVSRRAAFLAFGDDLDHFVAEEAGRPHSEQYVTVFALVAQVREIFAFATSLADAWGDLRKFSDWASALADHRRAGPEGTAPLVLADPEVQCFERWTSVLEALRQNLDTLTATYAALDTAAARFGLPPSDPTPEPY